MRPFPGTIRLIGSPYVARFVAATVTTVTTLLTAMPVARPLAAQDTSRIRPSAAATNSATTPGRAHRLLGVFDDQSGAPLEGAEIVDLFVDDVYRTEASGLLGLWALQSRNDSAAIRIRKIGYADTAFVVMVGPTDTTPIPVFLHRAIELPATVTSASMNLPLSPQMREFEERRNDKSLSGRFMDAKMLRRNDTKPIEDVIYDFTAGKTRACRNGPKIFLDGENVPMSMLARMTADNFEAMEYYTMASTPLRFGGTAQPSGRTVTPPPPPNASGLVAGAAGGLSGGGDAALGCGTVLLWLREKP